MCYCDIKKKEADNRVMRQKSGFYHQAEIEDTEFFFISRVQYLKKSSSTTF